MIFEEMHGARADNPSSEPTKARPVAVEVQLDDDHDLAESSSIGPRSSIRAISSSCSSEAMENRIVIHRHEGEILIDHVEHFPTIHQHSPWPSSRVGK